MSQNSSETIPTGIKDVTKIEEVELGEKDVQDSSRDSYAQTDGGWDGWGTVFGTALVSFGTFGQIYVFGAFSDYYNEQYLTSYSATLISMIGAVQVFILYIFAGTAGAVFDSIGPRYLVPASGVIVVFLLFMLSLTKPEYIFQQFLSQLVLFSLGATFSFFPSADLMAHWFKLKIPYAIGCLASGASFAFITVACFAVGTMTIKQRRPSKPFPTSVSALFDFTAFKDPCCLFLVLGCWFTVFAVFNPFFYVNLSAEVANPSSQRQRALSFHPLRSIDIRKSKSRYNRRKSRKVQHIIHLDFDTFNINLSAMVHFVRAGKSNCVCSIIRDVL
ncbi:hypothetical protein EV359DRAFT_82834 [Lentinula novae-zelandiae]|nr:hypothetical protein EV359DRAFT_82834 [Lentinula novae-zelandiae]